MGTSDDEEIQGYLDFDSMKVVLADGNIMPIDTLFDKDGDETDDPGEALAVLAGSADVGWFTASVDPGWKRRKWQ
jgi:LDH2 family malate/lactate/ureidoglycolate dehydrogenase